jgi:hypothetical protein
MLLPIGTDHVAVDGGDAKQYQVFVLFVGYRLLGGVAAGDRA